MPLVYALFIFTNQFELILIRMNACNAQHKVFLRALLEEDVRIVRSSQQQQPIIWVGGAMRHNALEQAVRQVLTWVRIRQAECRNPAGEPLRELIALEADEQSELK